MPRFFIALLVLLICASGMSGQEESADPVLYPGGISLQFGMGPYALKDQYISPERYSGLLPSYALRWTRSHEKYVYSLGFGFGQSDDFKNHNVSSQVLSFKLSQGFLYSLKPVSLFQKKLGFWIGPTTDVFYFQNNPEIAVSGFDYTNSYVTLISLGFRGDAIYPLSKRFSMESSLQLTLISLGLRTVDSEEEDEAGVKLLSPFSGINASWHLGINYAPVEWLSLGVAYRYSLTRVTAWEDLLVAGNTGWATLQFRF